MSTKDQNVETRQRLLEAGGEVFAEHGFSDATVREICDKASANVAAVHYHFGDKEQLYQAVFDYARSCAEQHPEEPVALDASAEQHLHAFIRTILGRFFDEGRPAWLSKLVAQEMIEPTKVLDTLVNERIRPNHERLKAIARELIGAEVDDELLRQLAFSIAGQYLFYFYYQPIIARLYPDWKFGPQEIDRLAEHITKFSLAALKGYRP